MPPKTTAGEAYPFCMVMTKAVLDGRARELIDLAKLDFIRRGAPALTARPRRSFPAPG
ncbi:hypothetical protein [Aliidongia sp.]|uniref:hypothetical protein n=1 Tax=Aliidongia sp. TaxID=1914230 RepID=UPI002DDCCFC6|nr:hypothetical protein [Aliidongia sp.]